MPSTIRSLNTRRSECIFCIFRASQRPRFVLRPHFNSRLYHATSGLQRSRAAERQAREQARERESSRAERLGSKRQPLRSRYGRSGAAFDSTRGRSFGDAEVDNHTRERVRIMLNTLGAIARPDAHEVAPEVSYMRKMDPDGTKWQSFSSLLRELLEMVPPVHRTKNSGRQVGRLQDIIRAAQMEDGWYEALQQQIEFAFIDFALVAKPSNPQSVFDLRYPTEWYPRAREMQREIHLHVGPTNSGKTYTALKRLEESRNGFYAGPLRLLAHEVYSRFNNRGIPCDLVTGDDVRLSPDENIAMYASTVEMVSTTKQSDVGVIDEIQMIGDEERGWAWTRALLGARAKELHLCGEARVVPLVREIVASMGDTLHVHQYDRLNPLKVMSKSLRGDLTKLRKGDCIVAFSVVNIHALKAQIEVDTGRHCAIVYGSLPPETRAQQAALFNDPDNDYDFLVASDAIGMGLNLSIKRVVFETTTKWNGVSRQRLSISQLKQIAGRAGRFRTSRDDKDASGQSKQDFKTTAQVGLVTCLDEADLPYIQQAMATEAPPLRAAGILPPGEVYEDFAARLPENVPFEYVMRRVHDAVSLNTRYSLCDARDVLSVARVLDAVPGLSIEDRLTICASPAKIRGRSGFTQDGLVRAIAAGIAAGEPFTIADVNEIPLEVLDAEISSDRIYLEKLEFLHKVIILFLWLSYRFPRLVTDQDMAVLAKQLTEEKINVVLTMFSANPRLRARLTQMKKSSAILKERLATSTKIPSFTSQMTMNPDASVEEVERRAREEAQRNPAGSESQPGSKTGSGNTEADGHELESNPASISDSIPNTDGGDDHVDLSGSDVTPPPEPKRIEHHGSV